MGDCSEPRISRIKVNDNPIGLRDLDEAFQKVRAGNITGESQLRRALLEEVRNKKNYIPAPAEKRYEKALLREYRRFLGEPVEEDEQSGLSIKVLGRGCPNCRRLTEEIMAALTELALEADVEHVTDIERIAEYGAVGTPALVVNKKIVSVGRVPGRNTLRAWLEKEARANS